MVHTYFVVGMHVLLSFLLSTLLNAIDISLTKGWTGVVDAYFWMTKDPQLGTGS